MEHPQTSRKGRHSRIGARPAQAASATLRGPPGSLAASECSEARGTIPAGAAQALAGPLQAGLLVVHLPPASTAEARGARIGPAGLLPGASALPSSTSTPQRRAA